MKLTIIGTGYVGLVTGTCFAEKGHDVLCVDNDPAKIARLQAGQIPIFEPGLEPLVHRNVAAGRLHFTADTAEGVRHGHVIFIGVPTPPRPDGSVDMRFVERVARDVASAMTEYRIIVDKSTVPVKTGLKVAESIKRYNKAGVDFDVISNPEFMREGCAVEDQMKPERIVIGVASQRPVATMQEVYAPFNAPIIVTDINSAELIKHASNSFLALKISYANALSALCEASHANIQQVVDGIGLDRRIGRAFLNAGLGYGGSCFPKDISAFIHIAQELGYDFRLLKEVQRINTDQLQRFVKRIQDTLWVLQDKVIAVLGLAFKANTDDARTSPAVDLVLALQKEGAHIRAYDPQAMEKARPLLPDVTLCPDPYEAVRGADAMIIATEWDEFKNLDFGKIKSLIGHPTLFDGRNLLDPMTMKTLGFTYLSVGR
ncbi:MAG: UDP-glucose/GDP-mannose dehydrogenase family protein [Verrucomicrobia bacterium]|nr:UDP-glucose/GDP-mannose dehydrogenase family protein [Verrucomicrobiota bacterium]